MGEITLGPNLIFNGDLEIWSAGPSAAPDNWILASGVARESTIVKIGSFSAKVTRSGSDKNLNQAIPNPTSWVGRIVTWGAWVYATTASQAVITIRADSVDNNSSFHTGGGTWEWIEVSHTVVTDFEFVYLEVKTSDGDVFFDGGVLISDEIPIPLTPGFGFQQALTMVSRQDQRVKEGQLYTYIENGTFRRFNLPWSWVSSGERSLVNSWWQSGQDLRFLMDSSFSNSFFTVRIMGAEEPFQEFIKPYGIGDSGSQPFYDGEIVLETT